LPWCPAIRREKPGIAHNNASTSRTGGGNIKAIRIIEELHSSGRVFWRRSSHGIYDDGRLLSLKLVNRSDLSAHDALFKPVYLIVVRRDDENIIQAQRMRNAVTVNPSGSRPREVLNDGGDAVDLFR
jgi:hypothetical protein